MAPLRLLPSSTLREKKKKMTKKKKSEGSRLPLWITPNITRNSWMEKLKMTGATFMNSVLASSMGMGIPSPLGCTPGCPLAEGRLRRPVVLEACAACARAAIPGVMPRPPACVTPPAGARPRHLIPVSLWYDMWHQVSTEGIPFGMEIPRQGGYENSTPNWHVNSSPYGM